MRAIAALAAVFAYLVALAVLIPGVVVDAFAVGTVLALFVGAVLAFGERVAP